MDNRLLLTPSINTPSSPSPTSSGVSDSEDGYSVYSLTPHLDFGPPHTSRLRAVLSSCLSNSLAHEVLDHDALHRKFSGRIGLDRRLYRDGGAFNHTKALSMFLSLASDRGSVLRDKTDVKDIRRDEKGHVVISCGKGEVFRGGSTSSWRRMDEDAG
ncbi:hypothetical protein MLD38_006083 [Melastoma candidum]|uniref:Uncharacterized protein n=1 Tax=Melastoma candidum TaxID=119954 RepID=A0ACB9RLU9_9MYRT|nr:hypothetical protein MLD38_006083 [Melastoma candidum]